MPAIGSGVTSHVMPIYQHSVFDFGSIEDSLPALAGSGHVYRRLGVPNTEELANAVATLEAADAGLATGSGMGAIVAAVLGVCSAGDSIAVQHDAYGGTRDFFVKDCKRLGIEVRDVDVYDVDGFAGAVAGAKLALFESVSNPLLKVAELGALIERCRAAGVVSVVDNTFATPLRDRPIERGADLVVHSATKFLGGHHDLCAGVVAGRRELVASARGVVIRLGLGAAPFDAWLAVRGIRTLELRMNRAWETAAELARRLRAHPGTGEVYSAERCALVAFELADADAAARCVKGFELIALAPSLGGVTTTVSHPSSSSHRGLSPEERKRAGISDGLLRISVGIESVEDVWADLEAGLEAAG
jgi:cystathionine beta-lyase/cystathionine gamma-synthase